MTIQILNPAWGLESGTGYVLPVDSLDAEHACASTLANAASSQKTQDGAVRSIAFMALDVNDWP